MIVVIVLLMIGLNQKKANQELQQEVVTSEVLDDKNKQHSDLEQQIKQLNDDNYTTYSEVSSSYQKKGS